MKVIEIDVTFTFKGKVKIVAKDKARALKIANDNFGMTTSSGIHTDCDTDDTESEGVLDWEFSVHPDKKIKKS